MARPLRIEYPGAIYHVTSRGMRQLNGVYTQRFNRRHRKVGHQFQGRFKAILVERDGYLLELCRYVVLNPVCAKMVKSPQVYVWSSYWPNNGAGADTARPFQGNGALDLLRLDRPQFSLSLKRFAPFRLQRFVEISGCLKSARGRGGRRQS